jgi:mono/diheme cytochrome c family protein
MKKVSIQVFAAVATFVTVLVLPTPAHTQNASEAIYKSKCAACHGADGAGSAMGTKLGVHDFHSADVQKQTDAALTEIIATGKNKMPSYAKTLKADEITALVAYVRTLAPAK